MERILVIEDDEEVREILCAMLENEGYDVISARDGVEGVRLFRLRPSDLVITDIIMPGSNGMEAILTLKRAEPGLKVIAISGGGTLQDHSVAPENYLAIAEFLGAQQTLSKPFHKKDMIRAVRDVLNQRIH
jgi:CheY-like chemotaxis protein